MLCHEPLNQDSWVRVTIYPEPKSWSEVELLRVDFEIQNFLKFVAIFVYARNVRKDYDVSGRVPQPNTRSNYPVQLDSYGLAVSKPAFEWSRTNLSVRNGRSEIGDWLPGGIRNNGP